MIDRIVHKLRDLDALITAHGQCMRCHRSWRYAAHVTVWYRPGSGTFLLCIACWQEVRIKATAGLILQGYAQRHIDRTMRTEADQRDILAAYGMAWRFPVEVVNDGEWPADSFGVRVMDRRLPVGVADSPELEAAIASAGRSAGRRPAGYDDPFPDDEPPGWNGAGADVEAQRG